MAFDSLPFKWTAEVFATHNAAMDEEHKGTMHVTAGGSLRCSIRKFKL
jgi:hypothetical protein